EGVSFRVEIDDTRLSAGERAFLHAVLAEGAAHASHPYQFGANGADGWGRVRWTPNAVTAGGPTPADAPTHHRFELTLAFRGPFLVNDPSRAKQPDVDDGRTNFTPLRRADGSVWLPASSFRGALRQRAEFLLRSADPAASGDPNAKPIPGGPIETLFGHTGRRTRLTLTEFAEVGRCAFRHQDFVAIDRFTGGAADGAKFDATFADRPTLRTTLVLDTAGLHPTAEKLLAAALRDVCRGDVPVGFGAAKGYGAAEATLCDAGRDWLRRTLGEPRPAPAGAAPASSFHPDFLDVEVDKNGRLKHYLRSRRTNAKGQPQTAPWAELSKDIQAEKAAGSYEVEYDLSGDQPVGVRYRGKEYVPAAPPRTAAAAAPALKPDVFAHPYYFLPLKDRTSFAGELADGPPAGHARYEPGRYSGTVRVRLTTETPLLVCDTDPTTVEECNQDGVPAGQKKGHKTFAVRKDGDRPRLASSSVRGALRAAFEAVTNSRFGVFPFDPDTAGGHARRLGLRPPAQSGLITVPVRVEAHAGGLRARVLAGTTPLAADGRPANGAPVPAACVAMYNRDWNVPNAAALRHGDAGWAFVGPWQHQRFRFWNVEAVHVGPDRPTRPPTTFRPGRQRAGQSDWDEARWCRGWVCVTHRNIDGKHDERFFFDEGEPRYADLGPAAAADYAHLIRDYQEVHAEELRRGVTRPPALKADCRFSRHITHDLKHVAAAEREAADGTLAYAALRSEGGRLVVAALYPVMISRRLHPRSPLDLVPKNLLPAVSEAQLSPADRVFGWVRQQVAPGGTEPAHRGHVRVGPVGCVTPNAVEDFPEPVPLAILGQPKPAQGRFYLGGADGRALPDRIDKEKAGYREGNRVRGPKVYPHHRRGLDAETWRGRERSSQNRSVRGWVKPGVVFEFDLAVTNLTAFELGGLLWLLSLPAGHFLRLGLGKPLGFGSVRAEVVASRLADGAAWAAAAFAPDPPDDAAPSSLAAEFEKAMTAAHPDLLKAFRVAAAGWPDLPVRYPPPQPGVRPQPEAGGEHYQWFAANERESRDGSGRRLSLPDLLTTPAPSLPDVPT
ncbi:MAG TPA: TIGR03986 family CRISPR-associated RAMP protein, partial [Urbifossiella sp.]|nr:TIGR03986 family CRISPR-associated RAMP protein [Urbifossiella sp.]